MSRIVRAALHSTWITALVWLLISLCDKLLYLPFLFDLRIAIALFIANWILCWAKLFQLGK